MKIYGRVKNKEGVMKIHYIIDTVTMTLTSPVPYGEYRWSIGVNNTIEDLQSFAQAKTYDQTPYNSGLSALVVWEYDS